jgi:hypothetical protein
LTVAVGAGNVKASADAAKDLPVRAGQAPGLSCQSAALSTVANATHAM